jgi:hypothetical protein
MMGPATSLYRLPAESDRLAIALTKVWIWMPAAASRISDKETMRRENQIRDEG